MPTCSSDCPIVATISWEKPTGASNAERTHRLAGLKLTATKRRNVAFALSLATCRHPNSASRETLPHMHW